MNSYIKRYPMANRLFNSQFRYGFERMPVSLFIQLTIGSSGAVAAMHGLGVASVTKNGGTGDYTILLQDSYNKLLMLKSICNEDSNSGTAPLAPGMYIKSEDVAGAKTINVITTASTNTATNPAANEIILIEIILSNSSVNQ